MAEGDKTPQKSEAEQALETQKRLAILQKEIAEAKTATAVAEAAALKAKLPATETTGQEGKVTADANAGYYAIVLAYKSLGLAAKDIANKICAVSDIKKKTVVLLDDTDLAASAARWNMIDVQFKRYKAAFEYWKNHGDPPKKIYKRIPIEHPAPVLVAAPAIFGTAMDILGAAPAILGTIVDIARFFKQGVTLKGVTVTLDEQALRSAIAQELLQSSLCPKAILNPSMALVSFNAFQEEVLQLGQIRQDGKSRQAELKAMYNDRISALEEGGEPNERTQAQIESLTQNRNEIDAEISTVLTGSATFLTFLTTADDKGLTPLDKVGLIDVILKNRDDGLLLKTDIVSKGGEMQTTSGGIFSSGNAGYMGSATVTFQLSTYDGELLKAGLGTHTQTRKTIRKNGFSDISEAQ